MDKKIIIAIVLAVVIVGSAAAYVAYDMMTYEKKTVEIFENGTTMVVPATLELTNRSDISVTDSVLKALKTSSISVGQLFPFSELYTAFFSPLTVSHIASSSIIRHESQ